MRRPPAYRAAPTWAASPCGGPASVDAAARRGHRQDSPQPVLLPSVLSSRCSGPGDTTSPRCRVPAAWMWSPGTVWPGPWPAWQASSTWPARPPPTRRRPPSSSPPRPQPARGRRAGRRPADGRGVHHRDRPVHRGLQRGEGPPRAARTVAEALADPATDPDRRPPRPAHRSWRSPVRAGRDRAGSACRRRTSGPRVCRQRRAASGLAGSRGDIRTVSALA